MIIKITYDTSKKTLEVIQDGEKVENVSSIDLGTWDIKRGEYFLEMREVVVNEKQGTRTVTSTHASENDTKEDCKESFAHAIFGEEK